MFKLSWGHVDPICEATDYLRLAFLSFLPCKGTSCNPSFRVRREMPETQMFFKQRNADATSSKERQTSPEVKLRTITRRRCTRSKPMRHWYVEPSRHLAFSSRPPPNWSRKAQTPRSGTTGTGWLAEFGRNYPHDTVAAWLISAVPTFGPFFLED